MAESAATTKRLKEYSEKIKLLPGLIETIAKHEKTLYGNGVPGMDEQMRNIWTWIETQKKIQEAREEAWKKFGWIIVSSLVGFFLIFIVQFVTFWVKIVPELSK